MKMIWITQECILPMNTGGRIGIFKRLEQIYKNFEIYLFYTYDREDEKIYKEELEKYCHKVFAYKRGKNFSTLKNLFRYPYCIASRACKEMQLDIEKCIVSDQISIVNIDFPQMCVNVLELAKKYRLKIYLNEHNIEWQFYRMISNSSRKLLKKIAYGFDSIRLKKYERGIVRRIDFKAITFVSEKDLSFYKKWLNLNVPHVLIPVGADRRELKESPTEKDRLNILFVGKMSADTNVEAVTWFAKRVLPRIVEQIPNVCFYIVGKEPTDAVIALTNKHVCVTGTVDSIDDYYYDSDLVVLPLLHGSGVKIKLLEAVSYKKPLITTSVGVEGTKFINEEDLIVEDDPIGFAQKCIEQLSDKTISYNMVENAYQKFLQYYTWEQIGAKYCRLFDQN